MSIKKREHLSQYPQLSTLIYHMLTPARAGGLNDEQAEAIYTQLMESYKNLDGDAFPVFKDEIIKILVTPDSEFEDREK